jgi:thymidylate synthase ThyX
MSDFQGTYSINDFGPILSDLFSLADDFGYQDLLKVYAENYKDVGQTSDYDALLHIFSDSLTVMKNNDKVRDMLITLDSRVVRVYREPGADQVNVICSASLQDLIPKEKKAEQLDKEMYGYTVFTTEEANLLSNYVTNLDGNAYCFKNLPEEVVAVLLSYVSRSSNTFKENLLKLLKDEELGVFGTQAAKEKIKEYIAGWIKAEGVATGFSSPEGEKPEDLIDPAIVEMIDSLGSTDFNKSSEKAAAFHEKWVLGYGHSSCSELSNIKFGVDRISILATKELEDNRLASYIEKSTRYQEFDGGVLYHIPDELPDGLKVPYCDLMDYTFDVYRSLFGPVKEKLRVVYPKDEGVKDKPYENSIHAKACDIIRYLLPASTYTALGASFNARAMAYAITKLKSHKLKECQELGDLLKVEALKICPTLVKYADYNDYKHLDPLKAKKFLSGLPEKIKPVSSNPGVSFRTPVGYQDLLNTLVAYILYPETDTSLGTLITYARMDLSQSYKVSIIQDYVKDRSNHDSLQRAFETIPLEFDIVCDYGAYRDLQRHRIASQFKQCLGVSLGYSAHPDLEWMDDDVTYAYHNVLYYQKQFYQDIIKQYPELASVLQYSLSLAWNFRFSMVMDLRQAVMLIELRSGSQGHISYRRVAQRMYAALIDKYPVLESIIRCNLGSTAELERLKSELRHSK